MFGEVCKALPTCTRKRSTELKSAFGCVSFDGLPVLKASPTLSASMTTRSMPGSDSVESVSRRLISVTSEAYM